MNKEPAKALEKSDFYQIQTFIIERIRSYLRNPTNNTKNKKIVTHLHEEIFKIAPGEDIQLSITELLNCIYQIENPLPLTVNNLSLLTFLHTLHKHIENYDIFKKMHVNLLDLHKEETEEKRDSTEQTESTEETDSMKQTEIEKKETTKAPSNNLADALKEYKKQYSKQSLEWIREIRIVIVTGNLGSVGNIYGHALLNLGNLGYLHVNTLYKKPYFLSPTEFEEYLQKQNCKMVNAIPIFKSPETLSKKQMQKILAIIVTYADHKWFWRIVHHNCETFAETVALTCLREIGKDDSHISYKKGQVKHPICNDILQERKARQAENEQLEQDQDQNEKPEQKQDQELEQDQNQEHSASLKDKLKDDAETLLKAGFTFFKYHLNHYPSPADFFPTPDQKKQPMKKE